MSEEELTAALNVPPEIEKLFLRRGIRMIYQMPIDPEDERIFDEWRKSQGLEPLDENNHPFK